MEDSQSQQTVLLHGELWHIADIVDEVEECRALTWVQQQWHSQSALVEPGGVITQHIGQAYDPQTATLVTDAWEHDHCRVCWWKLHETDDPEHGIGYTDGQDWLCTECYTKLVAPEAAPPTA